MTSTDLGTKYFKTCSWIPLTMVKSLLLNSKLLEVKITALAFNCSYASSLLNKVQNPLTVCGFHLELWNPQQLVIFACCGIRDTTNVPIKFTLLSYVRVIHGNFVIGNHLHFGLGLKISFWNKQIQSCAPIQCTVWPRNEYSKIHR